MARLHRNSPTFILRRARPNLNNDYPFPRTPLAWRLNKRRANSYINTNRNPAPLPWRTAMRRLMIAMLLLGMDVAMLQAQAPNKPSYPNKGVASRTCAAIPLNAAALSRLS